MKLAEPAAMNAIVLIFPVSRKTANALVKEALIPVLSTERIVQHPLIKPLRQVQKVPYISCS
ncbi:MAG: hypothetical protein QM715_14580 [Nibricoccus sp.]